MNIDRELLSKAVEMLKTFAADQVAFDPEAKLLVKKPDLHK